MKYIGHFIRSNNLTKENIKNQLFFFSKEAFQNVVLNSKCGITIPSKELYSKNIPTNDINIFNSFSPLLCIYKKATTKMIKVNDTLIWNEDKFKKEINITGNFLMCLSLLEVAEFNEKLKNHDASKYNLSKFYVNLAQKQLDFFISYLRSSDGVFIDKKDISSDITNEIKFEEVNKVFNYYDQAFIMAALCKYSDLSDSKIGKGYKTFALEILQMFEEYREELYLSPFNQLPKLCFGLNLYYTYSGNKDALTLLLDLTDLAFEKYSETNISNQCIMLLNAYLLFKHSGFLKFLDLALEISTKLLELYSEETGFYNKTSETNDINYYCDEIVLYLVSMLLHSEISDNENLEELISKIYKTLIVDSGIVSSWPESPMLDDVERYNNYSREVEDLLEDINFRLEGVNSTESSEQVLGFIKNITFNKRKNSFNTSKPSFDSTKNMFIYFICIFLTKNKLI